jgi:hypothetical protein
MSRRIVSILVVLAVTLTNAMCVCAGEGALGAVLKSRPTASDPHACCSDEMPGMPASDPHDAPAPMHHGNQPCTHCNGSAIIAPAPADAGSIAAPVLNTSPFIFFAFPSSPPCELAPPGAINHAGLPPPPASPTLLNLGCALNT